MSWKEIFSPSWKVNENKFYIIKVDFWFELCSTKAFVNSLVNFFHHSLDDPINNEVNVSTNVCNLINKSFYKANKAILLHMDKLKQKEDNAEGWKWNWREKLSL